MIYIFSSLIVLAVSGILVIVWKYYGSETKKRVADFWSNRSLPKLSFMGYFKKISISKFTQRISKPNFSSQFKQEKKPALNTERKGVHISSLVDKKPDMVVESKNKNKSKSKSKGRGKSKSKGKSTPKGEQFWIEVIKEDPKAPKPYKKLGEWYLKNKQPEYALKTFEHAAKLDPEDNEVKKHLKNLRYNA